MPIVTIRDLYVVELTELLDAEQQVLCELPLLSSAATADGLRHVFDEHYRQTLEHVTRLEWLFREIDERPRGTGSRGLRAIIEEARLRTALLDRGPARDAALLAVGQRIAHHEIGAYRSALIYAARLVDRRGAARLEETVKEEDGMSRRLEALAAAGVGAGAPPAAAVEGPVPSTAVAAPFVEVQPAQGFDSTPGIVSH